MKRRTVRETKTPFEDCNKHMDAGSRICWGTFWGGGHFHSAKTDAPHRFTPKWGIKIWGASDTRVHLQGTELNLLLHLMHLQGKVGGGISIQGPRTLCPAGLTPGNAGYNASRAEVQGPGCLVTTVLGNAGCNASAWSGHQAQTEGI